MSTYSKSTTQTAKVFEVQISQIVYVVADSRDKARDMIMNNFTSAAVQAMEHAIVEVDEISKITSVEKGREFDRPMGSERKILKELLTP